MSISNEITRLTNAKAAIKQSIVNKGVRVSDTALLDEYPALIDKIEGGGEGGGPNPYQELYMQRTANETSMVGLFSYTPASITLDLSAMNTSKVTDMSYMFAECKVPYLDLSGFDTSNVSNMGHMFYNCTSEINIDGWDTSKLTNISYMFQSFTGSIDLGKLDFSSVTNANHMFYYANTDKINLTGLSFPKTISLTYMFNSATGTTLDLSSWDISNVTDMGSMFSGSFTRIDLTGWNTSHVTNMNSMFYKYSNPLVELIIPDWDMAKAGNTNIFYNTSYIAKLMLIDLSRSNDATITKIASYLPTRTLATSGKVLIPVDSAQTVIDALIAKYWKPVGPKLDLISCEITTELDEIFPGKSTKLYCDNKEPWYGDDRPETIEYVLSDESVATIEGDIITSTGIEGTTEITIRNIETQEIISVAPITLSVSETDNYPNVIKFRGTSTPASNNYIKVNGTNVKLSAMNYNSSSGIYTYDVGAPITSIQFNGYGTSSYANTCTEVVKINTSNVTNMSNMFYYCSNFTSLDLSSFNISNVTNMNSMFYNCTNLTSLDLSNWDTSNVTNMMNMFYSCYSLHTLRLDNCNNDTISKIITSSSFPTGTIPGVTRKIYCKEAEAAGLTEPKNWVFEFVD